MISPLLRLSSIFLLSLWPLFSGCRAAAPELVLTYSPPEATISIDGYSPETSSSPHRFTFFADGRYRLRVEAPGHIPVEMFVEVRAEKKQALAVHLIPMTDPLPPPPPRPDPPTPVPVPTPTPTPDTSTCHTMVESVPVGAEVLAGPATGSILQSFGRTPVSIALSADQPTRIELKLGGFDTVRRLIPPVSQNCPPVVRIEMPPLTRGDTGSGNSPLIQPEPVDEPVIPDHPIEQENSGLLSVVTTPWTFVYLDGVSVGSSPITGYRLSAGPHTVIMENRDLGKRRVKKVNIRPGDHVRLAEEL